MKTFNSLTGHFLAHGGLKVFPCQEAGPSTKAPYTKRGFKDATSDMAIVSAWSRLHPNALWGVPCAMNGVLVLDADRHGKGDGVSNIMRLFERHGFDCHNVPMVATPRGGYHFYFGRPDWLGRTRATLCDAVDIRDDAYVIAPGCKMRDGGSYELVEGSFTEWAEVIVTRTLRKPPPWLTPLLRRPSAPPPREFREQVDDESLRNQMRGIIRTVLNAQEGQRNSSLYWAACRFAEFVRDDIVLHDFAEALLEEAGERVGLPAQETRSTVASGLSRAREGDRDAC